VRTTARALVIIAAAVAISPVGVVFLVPLDAALAHPAPARQAAVRGADGGAKTARAARDPGCIYGRVLDGHTGQIRCLSPEEITPPGPYDIPPPDAGADGSRQPLRGRWRDAGESGVGVADGANALRAMSITIDSVDFENGDVPRARAALDRFAKKDLVRCANEHDGKPGRRRAEGGDSHVDLRFLVRAPGRAEGIDVSAAHGVSAGLVQCITSALANRPIGAPSDDPVAVSVRFRFR
jgi:hypothetical protein